MCFECCDCILMKEVEQKAHEEGIVPLNKLARYEAEEVRRRVNLGKDVPAVLALLPEPREGAEKTLGAQVEGVPREEGNLRTPPTAGRYSWTRSSARARPTRLVSRNDGHAPRRPKEVTVGKTVWSTA